jgi:membrane-bound lytic murein transglycosylase D
MYELAICLGNRGARDGYLRTLRNLNPRYQADSWLPAGTALDASARIAGLYQRYCVQGQRATLAQTLVTANADAAIVRVAAASSGGAGQAGATAAGMAEAPAPATRGRPNHYRVQRGETLSSIARKFQCAPHDLAKSNAIKAPAYRIHPGQSLSLATCE